MTTDEFEAALNELETRVDRLRALYENWFRGYEKSEPSVARKEVERRVYALRKELPRNTALRFRYHQLNLRFTSLSTYWQRTARQIEDGTHKLQHQRMRRRHQRADERAAKDEKDKPEQPRHYELDLDESLNVDNLLDDLELDEVAKAIESPGPHSQPPPPALEAPKRPPPAVRSFARHKQQREDSLPSLPPVSLDDAEFPPVQASFAARKRGPPSGASDFPDAPTAVRQQPLQNLRADRRELPFPTGDSLTPPARRPEPANGASARGALPPDLRLQGPAPAPKPSPGPAPAARPALGEPQRTLAGVGQPQAAPPRATPGAPAGTGTAAMPPRSAGTSPQGARPAAPGVAPTPQAAKPPGGGISPQAQAPRPGGPGTGTSAQAPRPGGPGTGTSAQAPKPAAPAGAMSPSAPRAPGAPVGTVSYAARPSAPTASSPQAPRPAAPGTTPAAQAARPGAPAASVAGAPQAHRPAAPGAAPQAPRAGNPAPAAQRAPAASGGTIVGRPPPNSPLSPAESGAPSEQRMKRIYDEYTAARRRNNEGEIRYEAMVSSIQKMLPELTKKHQGRPIDFEVVVKDGRVGLKPKAT